MLIKAALHLPSQQRTLPKIWRSVCWLLAPASTNTRGMASQRSWQLHSLAEVTQMLLDAGANTERCRVARSC